MRSPSEILKLPMTWRHLLGEMFGCHHHPIFAFIYRCWYHIMDDLSKEQAHKAFLIAQQELAQAEPDLAKCMRLLQKCKKMNPQHTSVDSLIHVCAIRMSEGAPDDDISDDDEDSEAEETPRTPTTPVYTQQQVDLVSKVMSREGHYDVLDLPKCIGCEVCV